MDNRHTNGIKPATIKAGARKPNKRKINPGKLQTKMTDYLLPDKEKPKKHFKSVDINNVKFKQLNNNKREPSMEEINKFCNSADQFICFGHEPNVKLGAPVALNKRHTKIIPWKVGPAPTSMQAQICIYGLCLV